MNRRPLVSFAPRGKRWSSRQEYPFAQRLRSLAIMAIAVTIPVSAWAQAPGAGGRPLVVSGVVAERGTESPINGATVRLRHESGSPSEGQITDETGHFAFPRINAGRYVVIVERIGYRSVEATVELAGPEVDIRVELVPAAVEMDGLVVATRRTRPGLEGFDRRRETRTGGGTFFTREEIESRNPLRVSDLLRLVPGVQVVPSGRSFGNDIIMRGGCRPTLVVDGMRLQPVSGFGIDELVSPHDLEGLEVYRSSFIPVEFGQGCGAVAVWTRRGDPTAGSPFTWKRVLAAVGIVAGILFLAR